MSTWPAGTSESGESGVSRKLGSIGTGSLPPTYEKINVGDNKVSSPGSEHNNHIRQQPGGLASDHPSFNIRDQITRDPDTVRTLERYEKAKDQLRRALKVRRNDWGSFEFPDLDRISEKEEPDKLQTEIDKVLDARIKSAAQFTAKGVVKQIFMALSPFAKNFLTVASAAQSVSPRKSSSDQRFLY
jgi:hypothetical protein